MAKNTAQENNEKNLISRTEDIIYPEIDCAILHLEEVMSGIKSDKDFDRVYKRDKRLWLHYQMRNFITQ
jgi:hypothetical protein